MKRRAAAFLNAGWRAAVVLLTIEIALVSALRYFVHSQDPPPPILANRYAHPFLIIHVVGGVTMLLVGPLQFVRRIRENARTIHRTIGLLYVGASLFAAPAGLMLALGTTAGPVATVGFAIPALLWPIFNYLGVRAAIGRRFGEHREWMLRSYAITSTAITLRLMLPFSGLVLGLPFYPAYRVISWLSWATNLAICEAYLRRNRQGPVVEPRLATA